MTGSTGAGTADTIAFIGTPLREDGSSWSKDTSQVYTVAATGGTPTQYSQVLPDCEYPLLHPGCILTPALRARRRPHRSVRGPRL